MSRITGKDTTPELTLRKLLHAAGFRFRLHISKLPGKPDIILPKYRTVIFVHGCFWHRHEGCHNSTIPKSNVEFWSKKFKSTVERDRRNQLKLERTGWQVVTIWECELESNSQTILEALKNQIIEQSIHNNKEKWGFCVGINCWTHWVFSEVKFLSPQNNGK